MNIRLAEKKDIKDILTLLSQVLEIHAALRPDLFITGTTKYTHDELIELLADPDRRIYVAVDEEERVLGYVFCEIREQKKHDNLVQFSSIYIDDLCVDKNVRGQHIGQALFEHVKKTAAEMGCYEISLNVWEGNDTARHFYDSMGFKPKYTMMEYILRG